MYALAAAAALLLLGHRVRARTGIPLAPLLIVGWTLWWTEVFTRSWLPEAAEQERNRRAASARLRGIERRAA